MLITVLPTISMLTYVTTSAHAGKFYGSFIYCFLLLLAKYQRQIKQQLKMLLFVNVIPSVSSWCQSHPQGASCFVACIYPSFRVSLQVSCALN